MVAAEGHGRAVGYICAFNRCLKGV